MADNDKPICGFCNKPCKEWPVFEAKATTYNNTKIQICVQCVALYTKSRDVQYSVPFDKL